MHFSCQCGYILYTSMYIAQPYSSFSVYLFALFTQLTQHVTLSVSYLLVFTYFYIYLYDTHTPVSAYVEIKFLEMCKHTLSMYPDSDNVLMMWPFNVEIGKNQKHVALCEQIVLCFSCSCQKPTSPTTMISAHFFSPCAPPSRSSRCTNKSRTSTSSTCCSSAAAPCTTCTPTTSSLRCCPSSKRGCTTSRWISAAPRFY